MDEEIERAASELVYARQRQHFIESEKHRDRCFNLVSSISYLPLRLLKQTQGGVAFVCRETQPRCKFDEPNE